MRVRGGGCHCGAVRFEVRGEPEEFTTCNCSICARRNVPMWMVHKDDLRIVSGEDRLTLYQWNTHIARHYFCSVCGIYPFHRKRMAPDHYSVNVHCVDGLVIGGVPVRETDGLRLSLEDRAPAR